MHETTNITAEHKDDRFDVTAFFIALALAWLAGSVAIIWISAWLAS